MSEYESIEAQRRRLDGLLICFELIENKSKRHARVEGVMREHKSDVLFTNAADVGVARDENTCADGDLRRIALVPVLRSPTSKYKQ